MKKEKKKSIFIGSVNRQHGFRFNSVANTHFSRLKGEYKQRMWKRETRTT